MNKFNYQLEKYRGRATRHTCPSCGRSNCFTYYIDTQGRPLSPEVGRCDHQESCGYEKTPRDYFNEHPDERKDRSWDEAAHPAGQAHHAYKARTERRTDYIPFHLIQQSEQYRNNFIYFLSKLFPEKDVVAVAKLYHLGSTNDGGVIFPQIDTLTRCHTGKIMMYGIDGHRIKDSRGDRIDWLHSRWMRQLRQQGQQPKEFEMTQCLFGEHLLTANPKAIVCIVESEKTAIICAMAYPDKVWVSVGSKQNLKPERCEALKGRAVVIFPDADAGAEWTEKAKALTMCKKVSVSDWWKGEAGGSKRDIADLIIEAKNAERHEPKEKPTTIGDICRWMHELNIPKERITFNI